MHTSICRIVVACWLCIGCSVAWTQSNPSEAGTLPEIDSLVEQAIADKQLPGCVVLAWHNDRWLHFKAYGQRQWLPDPLPMERDTLFDLASLTKPIATATSILILAERGTLDLQQPVCKYIPEFGAHGKESITIEQLLIHTGGMIPDNAMADYVGTRDEILDRIFRLKTNYQPGTAFKYSDVGFQVLGALVERCSGESLDQFSHREIFAPLEMHETGFLPAGDLKSRAAATQMRDGQWMVGSVHDPRAYAMGGVAGHAGLFSTASDLAKFAIMVIQRGEVNGVRILKPETIQQMVADHVVPNGIRGLGWDKRSAYSSNRGNSMSADAIGHGGFTGTGLWIDPQLQLFVLFLSNRVHPDGKGNVNPLIGKIGTIVADSVRNAPR